MCRALEARLGRILGTGEGRGSSVLSRRKMLSGNASITVGCLLGDRVGLEG